MRNFSVSPISILKSDRIDIIAKYLYARDYYKFQGKISKSVYNLYIEHIRTLNNFVESDGRKFGTAQFIESFNQILSSISLIGFSDELSVVPVGPGGDILDGAHRTAACLALGIPIPLLRFLLISRKKINSVKPFKKP